MDYSDQQQFLKASRMWGAVLALAVIATAIKCANITGGMNKSESVAYALVTIALAVFLYYTPDYLHLTTNSDKRTRWAIKVRWRIIAAVLITGLAIASNNHSRIMVLIVAAWLLAFNAIAKFVGQSFLVTWLWAGDVLLLATLVFTTPFGLPWIAALFGASIHLAIVSLDRLPRSDVWWLVAGTTMLFALFAQRKHASPLDAFLCGGLLEIVVISTLWLVHRAEHQNGKNIAAAIDELKAFTGYSDEKIKQLWATSNHQLARNFESAAIDPADTERLAEWYRQNSELYLFAISGYNLEYKRIRSNLNVLKLGSGACLDYGAGNGEVVLAVAHRGQRAAYYDVQSETMRFARWRAAQRKLPVEFFVSKQELLAIGKRFDTIFSLDVLEHLPDLPGELGFLSSLLNPGGRMVFDVPAGATKSHPMHLNHNLNVVAHLKARGLKDERSLWQKLPFRKEEKYIFRAR